MTSPSDANAFTDPGEVPVLDYRRERCMSRAPRQAGAICVGKLSPLIHPAAGTAGTIGERLCRYRLSNASVPPSSVGDVGTSKGIFVSTLFPIRSVKISDLQPGIPKTGEPICERIDPRSLFVDRSYQRNVGERGIKQIREIIENFCWTKYKPPICAYAEHEGRTILKVLDGQHTAIAAAGNPHVDLIPVMIVDAPETQAQAQAFVGLNTRRLAVTPLQIHQASVAAGDPDALTVELVCANAGIKLVKSLAGGANYRPRETVAVASVRALVDRHSARGARQILEVLANADLAPITTHHIRAAEILMTHENYKNRFEPEDLSAAIGSMFLVAEGEAKMLAHSHRQPFTEALASVWFRKTKKKRRPFQLVA